jgi:hypothetical protein
MVIDHVVPDEEQQGGPRGRGHAPLPPVPLSRI